MTGIPLVNSNSVNDINTSIIAIKKEMKSSGETEVNVNVNLPDTVIPVDEVTSGNMHSVTSNAVASHIIVDTFTTEMDINAQSWKEDIFENINKTGYSIVDCFLSVTTGGAFVENGAFTGNDLVYRVFNNAQIAQHYIVNLNVLYKKS